MKNRKIVVVAAAVALMALSAGTQARIGSSSSGGRSFSSSSSSFSSPSRSYSAPASSTSRFGGGQSIGMSRSNVMSDVRAQNSGTVVKNYGNVGPAQSAPVSPGSSYVAAPRATVPTRPATVAPSGGYSGAHVAGAAVAGAVVGALANQAMHSNTAPVVMGNSGYGYGGGQAPVVVNGSGNDSALAPVVINEPLVTHSAGLGFGSIFALLLLAGLGYGAYVLFRKNQEQPFHSPITMPTTPAYDTERETDLSHARTLLAQAPSLFRQLQDVNNRGDKQALSRLTTVDLYSELEHDIDTREAASQTEVVSLVVVDNEVKDFVRRGNVFTGSIHFRGTVREAGLTTNESIEEVWHFVKDLTDGVWRLAGIEQV